MTGKLLGMAVGAVCAWGATQSFGQETRNWSELDCAQSKIAAPAGLRCKATQNYSGGQGPGTTGVTGTFRRWTAFGMIGNAKLFYFLHEGTNARSFVLPEPLVATLKSESPESRGATQVTDTISKGGADFLTFVSGKHDACIAVRKYGTSSGTGYTWVIFATKCVPAKSPMSEPETIDFIAALALRR